MSGHPHRGRRRHCGASGVVSLTATSGDLQMQSTASIDVGGTLLQVMDQNAAAPRRVALRAAGDVVLAAGSRVNLAGSRSAPAGVSTSQAEAS